MANGKAQMAAVPSVIEVVEPLGHDVVATARCAAGTFQMSAEIHAGLKTGIIRSYVAHLAAAQLLYEKYGKHSDPWMTLVGYFNSLRELGGARRLVDDSIRSLLRETVRHERVMPRKVGRRGDA